MPNAQLDVALDKPLPQNPDAERSILGSILINNACFDRVSPPITTESFFKDSHRTIFRTMATMVEEGDPLDLLLLKDRLFQQGLLEQIGGSAYLSSLIDHIPDIANVERYAEVVIRCAKKRAGVVIGNALMRASLDLSTEPEEDASAAMALLNPQVTVPEEQSRPLIDVLGEVCSEQIRLRKEDRSPALSCGIRLLDDRQVFTPGSFVVMGAPTKSGKSSIMVNLADGLAERGSVVAIQTLETPAKSIGRRFLAMASGLPHSRIRDWRRLRDGDEERIAQARSCASRRAIFVGQGRYHAEDLCSELRRLKSMHGLNVLFLDYIQLCELRQRLPREERLSEVCKLLLATALKLEIVIFAMSQLNEDRKDARKGRVSISDLAYAKAIGKSARAVILYERPKVEDPEYKGEICEAWMSIGANNEGRTSPWMEMHFDEVTQRFTEVDEIRSNRGESACAQANCSRLPKVVQTSLVGTR